MTMYTFRMQRRQEQVIKKEDLSSDEIQLRQLKRYVAGRWKNINRLFESFQTKST